MALSISSSSTAGRRHSCGAIRPLTPALRSRSGLKSQGRTAMEVPQIPPATYEQRCSAAYQAAGADWFVIYADREHFANIMFLTGFDPRFEEAMLVLGPRQSRIIIVGNECLDYARLARLPGVEI